MARIRAVTVGIGTSGNGRVSGPCAAAGVHNSSDTEMPVTSLARTVAPCLAVV